MLHGGPDSPTPSPSGSIGAAIAADAVADMLPNDLQAETNWGMDESAWQQWKQTATSMPWRMVDAGGVQQASSCVGQGAPTVVYVDGWDSPAAAYWSLVAQEQAKSNRVCLFDRPGMGLSPVRRGAAPHSTPEQHAEEMLDMLEVHGETGPFVLVPWSYGGLVAQSAAAQHPELVAGMVLVDATSPRLPGLDEPWQGENGIVDTDSVASTVGEGSDMGDRPVIVLARGQTEKGASVGWEETWSDLQLQAATISDNSLYAIVDDSDHQIPLRNPAAVVAATSAVAESVRAGNADLPTCPDDLAAARVTCAGS